LSRSEGVIFLFLIVFFSHWKWTKPTPTHQSNEYRDMQLSGLVWFMVFIATFNNISVISWQSVSLVEETVVPGENHRAATNY